MKIRIDNYFQTWQLQLITKFMIDAKPITILKSNVAFADTRPDVDQLYEVIHAISSIKFEDEKYLFQNINYVEEILTIQLNEGITPKYIEKCLKQYIDALENDEITSQYEQHLSFNKQMSNFINLMNDDYNLKDFKLKEWKYLPIVLFGYIHKKIEIINILVEFPSNAERKAETFAIRDMVGEDLNIPIFEDEFLNFNCQLNVKKFYDEYKSKAKVKNSKELQISNLIRQDGNFSNQQQKLFDFIVKQVNNNRTTIPTADFDQFINESDIGRDRKQLNNAIARAIYKLNKQYKTRFNTKNNVIQTGNLSATYNVTEEFITFVEDNDDYI